MAQEKKPDTRPKDTESSTRKDDKRKDKKERDFRPTKVFDSMTLYYRPPLHSDKLVTFVLRQ